MDRSDVIFLISKTYTQNQFGQFEEVQTEHKVYCDVRSVSRAEWYDAGRLGFNPDIAFNMFRPDYHGEEELRYKDTRYKIYRTYVARNEILELYCHKIGGIVQNDQKS